MITRIKNRKVSNSSWYYIYLGSRIERLILGYTMRTLSTELVTKQTEVTR